MRIVTVLAIMALVLGAGPATMPATKSVADLEKSLDAATRQYRDGYQKRLTAVESLPGYAPLKVAADQADAKVSAAADADAKTAAAAERLKAKGALRQFVDSEVAKDESLAKTKKEMDSLRDLVAQVKASQKTDAKTAAAEAKRRHERLTHRIDKLEVGQEGLLDEGLRVISVVDEKSLVVDYYGDTLWLTGFSTAGMVDGKTFSIGRAVKISGTKSYETALGAKRTVLVVEPLE